MLFVHLGKGDEQGFAVADSLLMIAAAVLICILLLDIILNLSGIEVVGWSDTFVDYLPTFALLGLALVLIANAFKPRRKRKAKVLTDVPQR